jgi:Family of unknown function (DUF6304)
MFEIYPAKYCDRFGAEITTIENNRKSLRMILRGIQFQCSMLDDWKSATEISPSVSFPLHRGELCAYILDLEMPVAIVKNSNVLTGKLLVHLELGEPSANGGLDLEALQLELIFDDRSFKSCGKHGFFEDELLEIHKALPAETYLKSCFNCAFSDYCPAGFGLFGCMACFRNSKQEYRSLTGKAAFFDLQDRIAEQVQETYLCPEFERRIPNTGYRG